MRKGYLWLVLAAVVLAAATLLAGCTTAASSPYTGSKMKVVTSTTLLQYIARQVGGERVSVTNLVPAGQNPLNFTFQPADSQAVAEAKLLLLHGWDSEGFAAKLIDSAKNASLVVVRAEVAGNWMMPSVQSLATDKVEQALAQSDPPNAAFYKQSAADYQRRIEAKQSEVKSRFDAAKANEVGVISASTQVDFLVWAGFKIVASYNADSLNADMISDIDSEGVLNSAKIVVDSLQLSQDSGKQIAEDVGAKEVNLSSFPGGFENTASWEKAIDYNVQLLLQAIGK